jgi:GntR family transcriptional regulator of arabinose operon
MPIPASDNSLQPKYARITQSLREQIVQGEFSPGDRLPSFTEMKAQHGIALSTIEKVISTLEQEGLVERQHGRGTFVKRQERQKTGYIGFIGSASHATPLSPYHTSLMGGVQQAIEAAGQHMLYMGTDYSWDMELCDKVDGVLVCGIEDTAAVISQLPSHLPCVFALNVVDGRTSIGVDEYRSAQMAVRHLLQLGHRRIACLMESAFSTPRMRYSGYRDAMYEVGIQPHDSWMRLVSVNADKKTEPKQPYYVWSRNHMTDWLKNGWQETGCTAILVQNETAAIGVMQALQQAGINVPEQVSVIGFDGTELCELSTPRLSAVALPLEEIGRQAVELLNRQIAGEAALGQAVMLPCYLRDGDSIAVPAITQEAENAK